MPGPVFANVVLVDEINRTTPRTQSALLEPMEERQVTVEGVTHPLPEPYLVIATENPTEQHGTYPLPEGQLDRFALAVRVGYPDERGSTELVRRQLERHPLRDLEAVLAPPDVAARSAPCGRSSCDDAVVGYAVDLVDRHARGAEIALGASPRASVWLVRCAQARALLAGPRLRAAGRRQGARGAGRSRTVCWRCRRAAAGETCRARGPAAARGGPRTAARRADGLIPCGCASGPAAC